MIGRLRHYADWAAWLSPRRLWLHGWFAGPDHASVSVELGDGSGVRSYEAAQFSYAVAGLPAECRGRALLLDVGASWRRESEIRGVTLALTAGTVRWHGASRLFIEGDLGAAVTRLGGLPPETLHDLLGFVARCQAGDDSELSRRNLRMLGSLLADASLPEAASDLRAGWAVSVEIGEQAEGLRLVQGWLLEPPRDEPALLVLQPSGSVTGLREAAATYPRPDLDHLAARYRGRAAGFVAAFRVEFESAAMLAEPLIGAPGAGRTVWVRSRSPKERSLADLRQRVEEVLGEGCADDSPGAGNVVRELAAVSGRPTVAVDSGTHDGRRHRDSPPTTAIVLPVADLMRTEIQLCELARGGDLGDFAVLCVLDRSAWVGAVRRRLLGLAAIYGLALRVFAVADRAGWGSRMNAASQARDAAIERLLFVADWALPASALWWQEMRASLSSADTAIVGARTICEDSQVRDAGLAMGDPLAALVEARPAGQTVTPFTAFSAGPVAAVPPGCVGVRADSFDECGGFDRSYGTARAAVIDLCLRARAHGSGVALLGAAFYDLAPTEAPLPIVSRLTWRADVERLRRRFARQDAASEPPHTTIGPGCRG